MSRLKTTADGSAGMATAGPDNFGAELKRRRLAAGLTQEALAERAGISAKAVSDLERDPARTPRLDTLALLADALGLDEEERARLRAAARPESASSLRSERTSTGFPRPLTPLFGREGVAGAVAELIRRGNCPDGARLLVLTGPGGVGKTRLAIAVAERAAETFGDGVVFVDLAPLSDPALTLGAIARNFAIDEREKPPLRERLTAVLRRKRLLLVLDNFEHLLAARGELLALLEACPQLTALVTSRVALRVRGEREYRVAPLELPEAASSFEALARSPAVALFLDRARAAGVALDLSATTAPAVAEICRRLDGLPLAIELAAAWSRLLPPRALLARFERRLPLLIGGPHDLPVRQRTMRDTIAWSYGLLTDDEQRLFRRLSVFAGGCTPAAVAAVCSEASQAADESSALAGLVALMDRSLARAHEPADAGGAEPRVTILETLREYGLEQLETSGELALLRRRHAEYFLALAEATEAGRRGPVGVDWGARLEREHDNLRAALGWALAAGEGETALRLAGALWRFWADRGYVNEGRGWLRLALRCDADATDASIRVKALIGAAELAIDQGAYDDAEEPCVQAVAIARGLGMSADLVDALNTHGLLARERGEYGEASRHHDEALVLARAADDRSGEATALTGLGYATTFGGDAARGTALCEQSLTILREAADTRELAVALVGLAGTAAHMGAFARAEELGEEALVLFRALGDTGRIASALWVLGVVALMQETYERATTLLEQCLELCRERGNEHGANQPLAGLALIALREGRFARARTMIEESLTILDRYDDRWSRAMSLTLLGHVELAVGEVARAFDCFVGAAPLFTTIGNPLYVPWCLEGFAGTVATRGDWALAARLCGARDALRAQLGFAVPPANPTGHARTIEACWAALGEHGWTAAHECGRAWPPDLALAEASGKIVAMAPTEHRPRGNRDN